MSILLVLISACDKASYDKGYGKGYNEGFQSGQTQGELQGYNRGIEEGFENGYAAGFEKSDKAQNLEAIVISDHISDFLYVFGYIVAIVFLFINLLLIIICFLINTKTQIVLANGITVVMAIGAAYATMFVFDLSQVITLRLEIPSQRYLVYFLIFLFSLTLSKGLDELSSANQPYLVVFVIALLVFFTSYYFLLLTDIATYIIKDGFHIWVLFSILLGGAVYLIYKLIGSSNVPVTDTNMESPEPGL